MVLGGDSTDIKIKKILSILIGMIFLLVTPASATEIGTIHDTPTKKDNNNIQPTYKPQQSTYNYTHSPIKNSKVNHAIKNTIKDNNTLNELNFNLKETQKNCKEIYEPTMEIYNQTCAEIKNLTQSQTKLKQEYQEVKLNNSNISKQLKLFNIKNLTPKQKKEEKLLKKQCKENQKLLKTIKNNLKSINKRIKTLEKNKNDLNDVLSGLNQTINAETKASALPGINKVDNTMQTINLGESQLNSLNEYVAKYNQKNNTNITNKTKNKSNSIKPATLATEGGATLILNIYTAFSLVIWKSKAYAPGGAAARIDQFSKMISINKDIEQATQSAFEVNKLCTRLLKQRQDLTKLTPGGTKYIDTLREYNIAMNELKTESDATNRLCTLIEEQIEYLPIKNKAAIKNTFRNMGLSYNPLANIDSFNMPSLFIENDEIGNVIQSVRDFSDLSNLNKVQDQIYEVTSRMNVEYATIMAEKEGIQVTRKTTLEEFTIMAKNAEKRALKKSFILRNNFGIGAAVSVVFDIFFAVSMGSWAGYEIGLWEKDYVNDFVDELCSDTFNYLTS